LKSVRWRSRRWGATLKKPRQLKHCNRARSRPRTTSTGPHTGPHESGRPKRMRAVRR
jgi:hypothetical protein